MFSEIAKKSRNYIYTILLYYIILSFYNYYFQCLWFRGGPTYGVLKNVTPAQLVGNHKSNY